MGNVKGKQELYDNVMEILQIMEEESDSILYLFDSKGQCLFFQPKTIEVFGISAKVPVALEEVLQAEVLAEESKAEFARLHEKISQGDREAIGTVKLQAEGLQIMYELKLRTVYSQKGEPTDISIGRMSDVTQHYMKKTALKKYSRYLALSQVFDYVYDGRKDCFTITLPQKPEQTEKPETRNTFFFSKMIKEEKVCPKANIAAFMDFLQNGSRKPFQVRMYDTYSEEYRWYALTGELENETSKRLIGTLQDITEEKNKEYSMKNYDRVLDSLAEDYILILAVDMKLDTYEVLMGDYEKIENIFPKEGTYSWLNDAIAEHTDEAYAKQRKEFGSLAYLSTALKQKKKLVLFYKAKHHLAWRKAVIRVMEYDENGEPEKAIVEHIHLEQEDIRQYSLMQPIMEADFQFEKRPQVLLVEEYELNAKLAEEVLEAEGFKTHWVKDEEGALKAIKEAESGTYSLILVDVSLAGEAGFETGRKIKALMEREDRGEADIYALALQETADLDQKAMQAGMKGCIQKPLQAEQLRYLSNRQEK